jgi:hypothetical protein
VFVCENGHAAIAPEVDSGFERQYEPSTPPVKNSFAIALERGRDLELELDLDLELELDLAIAIAIAIDPDLALDSERPPPRA